MDKRQLLRWVIKNDKLVKGQGGKILKHAIALGGVLGKNCPKHHIESSYNSRDLDRIIKITHIYHFKNKRLIILADLIRSNLLAAFLKEINKAQKTNFNTEFFENIFQVPVHTNKKNDAVTINFDYDTKNFKIIKVSIFFNPKIDFFKKIFYKFPINGRRNAKKQWEFIGIDFLKENGIALKIYNKYKALPGKFALPSEERKVKEIFHIIKNYCNPDSILLMEKSNLGEKKFIFGGCYLYYDSRNNIFDVSMIKNNFAKLNKFFKKFIADSGEFNVNFFVIKPQKTIEIYFK